MPIKDRLLVAATLVLSLGIAPAAIFATPYSRTGPALAIIPPWKNAEAILSAAGLSEVAPVRAPFGVLVFPDQSVTKASAREHGVWMLLDGAVIAAICGVEDV